MFIDRPRSFLELERSLTDISGPPLPLKSFELMPKSSDLCGSLRSSRRCLFTWRRCKKKSTTTATPSGILRVLLAGFAFQEDFHLPSSQSNGNGLDAAIAVCRLLTLSGVVIGRTRARGGPFCDRRRYHIDCRRSDVLQHFLDITSMPL